MLNEHVQWQGGDDCEHFAAPFELWPTVISRSCYRWCPINSQISYLTEQKHTHSNVLFKNRQKVTAVKKERIETLRLLILISSGFHSSDTPKPTQAWKQVECCLSHGLQHFQQGGTKTLSELAGGVAGQAKESTGKQNKGNKGLDLQ